MIWKESVGMFYLKRSLYLFIIIILVTSTLTGCMNTVNKNGNQDNIGKIIIYTSVYPLYDFASKIGGDRVKAINLVPAGTEPHDYEPKPKDIIELSKANVFIYNGGGFESWVEKIIGSVKEYNENLLVVNSTEKINLLRNTEHDENEQEHEGDESGHSEENKHGEGEDTHSEGEEHDHGEFDPHVWLDPTLAKEQAKSILDALIEIDKENKEYYLGNYAELAQSLDELDQAFQAVVKGSSERDIVVSHAAYGYLTSRYHLHQVPITGLSPSEEPSTKDLKNIIDFVKENQVKYIFFETLVTPKVAEVIREEVGAEMLILHNLEGLTKEEISQGEDYFSIMQRNVETLRKALR